jgi:eukaryotic-like serine/threonine-protein kinase
MDSDRWSEVEKLYHAAPEREPSERKAFLSVCQDEVVRHEVQSLLEHEQEGNRLLENPQWRVNLSAESAPSLAAGPRLGPYEILEHIGRGGMGDVYRARDPRVGRNVAIKISSERFSERFSREVHAVAALIHPNICTLYDVGPNYLVMEFVDGPTLAERIGGRAMKREEALPIAKQIAEAVEYAHEKGVIHRDLKPANVKVTAEGKMKLLDFGLAKMVEGPLASSMETGEGTRTGMVMGTAAYMAPEQAQGRPVDRRTDIWAFGVVLYEMLTGKHHSSATAVLKSWPQ